MYLFKGPTPKPLKVKWAAACPELLLVENSASWNVFILSKQIFHGIAWWLCMSFLVMQLEPMLAIVGWMPDLSNARQDNFLISLTTEPSYCHLCSMECNGSQTQLQPSTLCVMVLFSIKGKQFHDSGIHFYLLFRRHTHFTMPSKVYLRAQPLTKVYHE